MVWTGPSGPQLAAPSGRLQVWPLMTRPAPSAATQNTPKLPTPKEATFTPWPAATVAKFAKLTPGTSVPSGFRKRPWTRSLPSIQTMICSPSCSAAIEGSRPVPRTIAASLPRPARPSMPAATAGCGLPASSSGTSKRCSMMRSSVAPAPVSTVETQRALKPTATVSATGSMICSQPASDSLSWFRTA